MSAYTVNLEHIHVLVKAGQGFGADRDRVTWATDAAEGMPGVIVPLYGGGNYRKAVAGAADDIGQMLVSANWRSVNYRYSEDEIEPVYQYASPRKIDREPVEILAAIACLRYQSCEFPEWATSEAARYLDAVEKAQIGRLPGWSATPGDIARDTLTLSEQRMAAAKARMQASA